ncbi:MAG TPA: GNAT family N-acetyltransferase [Candidatus Limnocylindria bacterium]|nr:GNAT family N-acetyltransferase [Candidatus Limnocylindria bacterium]
MAARRPRIRPIRRGDAPGLVAFYAALSAESRRSRFFGACRSISDLQAQRFARVRRRGGDGWVAVDPEGQIIGHVCLEPLPTRRERVEEIAAAVADAWRGRGIGRALVDAGIASARRRGVVALEATMLTGNQAIHALLEHSGLPWTCHALEPGSEAIRLELLGEAIPGAA